MGPNSAIMAMLPAGLGVTGVLLKGALGIAVGGVLGLLGGGGSILALPIFLEVFHEPSSTAIAESLLVVAVGAGVGLLAKLETINMSELAPLAAFAMFGSAITARFASGIPGIIRLGIFTVFALYSAVSMLQSVQGVSAPSKTPIMQDGRDGEAEGSKSKVTLFSLLFGVGSLTSIIGAGGGFIIVPVLTDFAAMEVNLHAFSRTRKTH